MSPQRLCTSKEKSPSPAPYHPSIVWQQFQKVSPILVIANLEKCWFIMDPSSVLSE